MSNEKLPEPRALTRKELRQLKAAGLDPFFAGLKDKTPAEVTEFTQNMCDYIVDNFFPNYDWDNVSNGAILEFGHKCYQLAYNLIVKQEEEIKNS